MPHTASIKRGNSYVLLSECQTFSDFHFSLLVFHMVLLSEIAITAGREREREKLKKKERSKRDRFKTAEGGKVRKWLQFLAFDILFFSVVFSRFLSLLTKLVQFVGRTFKHKNLHRSLLRRRIFEYIQKTFLVPSQTKADGRRIWSREWRGNYYIQFLLWRGKRLPHLSSSMRKSIEKGSFSSF